MNTHKVYTREQLEALTANELDEVYFYLVGYRPMQDDGISRNECIELILGQYDEIEKHKPATIEQPALVSAHTPGPWVARKMWNSGYYQIETQNGKWIADVKNIDSHSKANARLISLAPETAKERDELKEKLVRLEFDYAALLAEFDNLRTLEEKARSFNTEMLELIQTMRNKIADRDEWWMGDPNKGGFDLDKIDSLLSRARQ